MVKYSRYYFQRTLRRFISIGSGIDLDKCIISHDGGTSPEGQYCALTYVGEHRGGTSFYWDENIQRTRMSEVIHARYIAQFLREDSYYAAQKFVTFVDSHYGIAWASNAVIDGGLYKVHVYPVNGTEGNNYDPCANYVSNLYDAERLNNKEWPAPKRDVATKEIIEDRDQEEDAKVKLYVTRSGKIEAGIVTKNGQGYSNEVELDISSALEDYKLPNSPDGLAPKIVVSGQGFTLRRPIMIEQVDEIVSADFEQRTVVEMDIMFKHETIDPHSVPVKPYEIDTPDKEECPDE